MKFLTAGAFLFFFAAGLGHALNLEMEKEKSVEFHGTVSAVDLGGKTLTVRARQKDFVFQIDPERCQIVKDGRAAEAAGAPAPTLSSAQIGDSVVGRLVVENDKPIVKKLYLTTTPEKGVRVPDKPGFIVSPYRVGNSPGPAADRQRRDRRPRLSSRLHAGR